MAQIDGAITERNQRLIALQDRWDALRAAKEAFAREDYEAAMKTGVVCRKLRRFPYQIHSNAGQGFARAMNLTNASALSDYN